MTKTIIKEIPKVSVIVPTYNAAEYIIEAIESVLNQTYTCLEIIVVDDGSTDNTRNVLYPYVKGSLIRYIYQENQGPGAARNAGIIEAKGEYICFLDADDVYLQDSVLKRVKFLDTFPEVGLVFTDYYFQEEHIKKNMLEPFLENNDNFLKKIYSGIDRKKSAIFPKGMFQLIIPTCHPKTNTAMVKKEALGLIGLFRTDISCAEDNDLWLRIAMRYPVGYIAETTSIYKHYRSSLYVSSDKYYQDSLIFIKDAINKYDLDDRTLQLMREKLYNTYFAIGYYYFEKNEYKKARIFFLKSIKNNASWVIRMVFFIVTLFPDFVINALRDVRRKIAK